MSRRLVLRAAAALCATALCAVAACALMPARSAAADELGPLDQPVSAVLMSRLREISDKGLAEKPRFDKIIVKRIDDAEAPSKGPPVVLYLGADFCPYCAALRWPLALTLMRFGKLSGLLYTRSSGRDVYPNTATFSFRNARLESDLISFQEAELETRDQKPLQRPNDAQRQLFVRWDKAPYTQYPGSIPFLYLGGRYLELGSPFPPDPLQGLDWEQIAAELEQGGNAAWQDVIGEANVLTAAVCALTAQKPEAVCTAAGIKAAAARLQP